MTSTTDVWTGGRVSPRATCVLCPNTGMMTLDGTNTWVLREPGAGEVVVVDPGPPDESHLAEVLATAGQDGGRVALVLLTHHHADHTGSADRFAELTGAPVRGAGRGAPWQDGERLSVGGLDLDVLVTPGHTPDSVSFLLPADRLLLTGDTLLGRGSTIIPWPDGDVGRYLESLDRLAGLVRGGRARQVAPGHGPVLADPGAALAEAHAHRLRRLEEIRAVVDTGTTRLDDVVAAVYGPVEGHRLWASRSIVRSQLAYLGVDVGE
ncbi:MBL fold metallo-hydrolase [Georgenia sp. SYP-B2076]|uniref:MBL fold metallo-hydrolase n=1 Tax=Georgenia sp. SYP-B2076 TaxID=2495881 RepID=UPI000F8EC88D|nr:MBL fold metallo-hydrolase [Georgenia sp. SYP-B2076]